MQFQLPSVEQAPVSFDPPPTIPVLAGGAAETEVGFVGMTVKVVA
jgi:hypothetical protein